MEENLKKDLGSRGSCANKLKVVYGLRIHFDGNYAMVQASDQVDVINGGSRTRRPQVTGYQHLEALWQIKTAEGGVWK
ncbi:hypothetical protein BPAE_0072g00160 [Botrytis paeoniae]|uniref:Uncharacterized protein n=1 Tax=Botrytis paeoniae TaxID=278948 RepID=A0A4Z1FMD2_9HELO|nr:hypothetical protein BPAE_0072g00160 [Botrytis paeoniae]